MVNKDCQRESCTVEATVVWTRGPYKFGATCADWVGKRHGGAHDMNGSLKDSVWMTSSSGMERIPTIIEADDNGQKHISTHFQSLGNCSVQFSDF